ncbi:V-type ATP synthase subunit I [Candidatus Halobonum tyrrellensis]|uniref:A-type ATP synthase subunit I n=1 Tax=Candidatus Halobonum tyrrellensis G22 TaxID=1324957 RepID=V4GVT2_9EURY|nr:V-type ATP synthase subunit I [Candidatus Halobonum tyrrellensis]ESP89266.1 archaeal/vacuolar-type h+-ATPase subunit i [Candidatus Halobonum tyrrellensis G22]
MSKVSVTGSKRVMDEVIGTVYDLHQLHVTDYDDSWAGFDPGQPAEGAEDAADKLVTVRSIQSILGIEDAADEEGQPWVVTDEALDEELDEVRDRVNRLDDRRDELRDRLREVEERADAVAPFADLGVDLDLLQGYDTLAVAVGEGDRDEVERALVDAEEVVNYELLSGDDVLGVFAYLETDADADALSDVLVGVEFTTYEVPTVEGSRVSPEDHLQEIEAERQRIESDLDDVEDELETVRMDTAKFLLAVEERLTIEVQRAEAPLSFATTENAFVAEGWIPTERYTEFASAIQDAVGSHVEVEELERAAFGSDGAVQLREDVPPSTAEASSDREEQPDEEEEEPQRAVADGSGGPVVMRNDDPPVVQDNPGLVRPFEVLVRAVGRPKYSEFDPSIVLFLTFPLFFGFMIGDLGYGLLYTLIGAFLYSNFDSDAFKSMGGVTVFAGLFTMLFGVLYGEVFGLHLVATYFWEGALGMSPPIHKGLQPYYSDWATAWLVLSIVASVVHLDVGYVFSFAENYEFHGLKDAMLESGSWLLMLNGFWVFVLSGFLGGSKPAFIFSVFDGQPIALGFDGFSVLVGQLGFGAFLLGLVLIWMSGEWGEAIEALFLQVFVNGLSYTRLAAVLLAKAGMAFVVNLLFFGVYVTGEGSEAEWHFALSEMPEVGAMHHGHEVTEIMFGGLVHGGAAAVVGGILILLFGHLIVLVLGVTSAGLQAVRLEYYEFFSKFFDGGGAEYEPLGYEREHTTSE